MLDPIHKAHYASGKKLFESKGGDFVGTILEVTDTNIICECKDSSELIYISTENIDKDDGALLYTDPVTGAAKWALVNGEVFKSW